ncbi:hypothetical protein Ciccas_003018 [Cichlidogyrus casuarinus]|uniref:Tyrosine-protein kinase ephrin type A/B receptor-like domain-containing protein n=1 Tax=Cichlidogyrus casuarinus TaxID=1844966 RepID=A0ABD2QFK7_9PLAT
MDLTLIQVILALQFVFTSPKAIHSSTYKLWLPMGSRYTLPCSFDNFNEISDAFSFGHVWYDNNDNFIESSGYLQLVLPVLGEDTSMKRELHIGGYILTSSLTSIKCRTIFLPPNDQMIGTIYSLTEYQIRLYDRPVVTWSFKFPAIELSNLLESETYKDFFRSTTPRFTSISTFSHIFKDNSSENLILDYRSSNTYQTAQINPFTSKLGQAHAEDYNRFAAVLGKILPANTKVIPAINAYCKAGFELDSASPILADFISSQPNSEENTEAISKFKLLCVPCRVGFAASRYHSMNGCERCPIGSYRDASWPASLGCAKCPLGLTTRNPGAKNVTDCTMNRGLFGGFFIESMLSLRNDFITIMETKARLEKDGYTYIYISEYLISLGLVRFLVWVAYLVITTILIGAGIYRATLIAKMRKFMRFRRKLYVRIILEGNANLLEKIVRFQSIQGLFLFDKTRNEDIDAILKMEVDVLQKALGTFRVNAANY